MDHVPLTPLLTHPLVHQFLWILQTLTFLYHSSTIPNLDYQSCTAMNYNNKMMNNLVTFYKTESSQKRTPPKALTLLTDECATVQIQGMHTS
jgi:hypothetical protein